jgi:endonuclease/exonuclease/phosphatase family metal-dependent hydrolase
VAIRLRGRKRPNAVPGEGERLVVATYNVHTCVGVDRRYDPPRVAQVLRELDADVISLQEVDARKRGDRHIDQWHYFAEATGLAAVPGANVRDHRGRFGNAVLTRWPVRQVRLIDLSVPGHEPRGAIDLDLEIRGRLVRVVATHLGLRAPERRQQTKLLLDAVEANGGGEDGLIIMGDLNEWRGRRGGIPALDRELGRAPAPRTFPSWCPVLPLDRIYAGGPAVLEEVEVHRSALARVASDHLPLLGRIRFMNGAGAPDIAGDESETEAETG